MSKDARQWNKNEPLFRMKIWNYKDEQPDSDEGEEMDLGDLDLNSITMACKQQNPNSIFEATSTTPERCPVCTIKSSMDLHHKV
jgi:hypothetical protein